jgi:hypothetical protein
MNIKKFCFIGTFAIGTLTSFFALMPHNNIDLNSNYLYENKNQEQMKVWLKEDKKFIEFLFPINLENLQIFVHNDKTIINKIFQKFYHCYDNDFITQECQNLNGYSSYFTNKRYEFSFVNNIVIGQHVIDQDYGQISQFLQDKRKLLDLIFFHEFGHYLLFNNPEQANIFFEQNNLTLEEASLINESFADTFSIVMMHYKYPEIDIEKLKESVIQYRLEEILENPTYQTYQVLMNFKIPETKDLNVLLSVCLEASKQTFFTLKKEEIKKNIKLTREKSSTKPQIHLD